MRCQTPENRGRYSKSYAMTATLIIVVVLILIGYLVFSSRETPEKIKEKGIEYLKEAEELELRHHYIIVKGLEYRKEQARAALQNANTGDAVQLVKEPDNEHDRFAVKVYYNDIHVGYIPRDLSREVTENFNRIQKAVISSAIAFTRIPSLNIELEYYREKGLSEEAIDFILNHKIK